MFQTKRPSTPSTHGSFKVLEAPTGASRSTLAMLVARLVGVHQAVKALPNRSPPPHNEAHSSVTQCHLLVVCESATHLCVHRVVHHLVRQGEVAGMPGVVQRTPPVVVPTAKVHQRFLEQGQDPGHDEVEDRAVVKPIGPQNKIVLASLSHESSDGRERGETRAVACVDACACKHDESVPGARAMRAHKGPVPVGPRVAASATGSAAPPNVGTRGQRAEDRCLYRLRAFLSIKCQAPSPKLARRQSASAPYSLRCTTGMVQQTCRRSQEEQKLHHPTLKTARSQASLRRLVPPWSSKFKLAPTSSW